MIHLQTTIIIHYHPLSSQKHKKKQGNGWERRKEPPCRFRCCPMLWHCQVWQLDLPKGSWIQQLTTRRVQKATPVSTLGASFLFVTSIPWLKFAQKAPTKKRQKQNRQWLLDPHNPLLSLILQKLFSAGPPLKRFHRRSCRSCTTALGAAARSWAGEMVKQRVVSRGKSWKLLLWIV